MVSSPSIQYIQRIFEPILLNQIYWRDADSCSLVELNYLLVDVTARRSLFYSCVNLQSSNRSPSLLDHFEVVEIFHPVVFAPFLALAAYDYDSSTGPSLAIFMDPYSYTVAKALSARSQMTFSVRNTR